MGYWKSKVLPKIKKVFETKGPKKTAAAEACKSFDASKEAINKEFEEKKTELQPKVVEIYEASSTEIKTAVKERNDAGIKNSVEVHKFLEELVKIDFPGSKQVFESSKKFGPAMVSDPIFFVFEKVSTFVITEEKEVGAKAEEETGKKEEKEKALVVKEEKEEKKKEKEVEEKDVVEEATEKPEPTTEATNVVEEEAKKP